MNRIALIAGLLLTASIGFGQTSLATVTGTITDATGAVVANAPVTLKNLENGQVYAAASSETGNFTVSQLPIGDYSLTVTVAGFKTYSHTKFHLAAEQTMREDIALQVGQNTESVTVRAESQSHRIAAIPTRNQIQQPSAFLKLRTLVFDKWMDALRRTSLPEYLLPPRTFGGCSFTWNRPTITNANWSA